MLTRIFRPLSNNNIGAVMVVSFKSGTSSPTVLISLKTLSFVTFKVARFALAVSGELILWQKALDPLDVIPLVMLPD